MIYSQFFLFLLTTICSRKIQAELSTAVGDLLEKASNPQSLTPAAETTSTSNKENTLLQVNYPAIRYWFKQDYLKALDVKKEKGNLLKVNEAKPSRGKTRLAETGENVVMDYIETENGESIDGATASAIRTYLRSLFFELKYQSLNGGIPMPDSWGSSGASMCDGIILKLYARYPYLRFCHQDWKVGHLLSRGYSSWKASEKKKAEKTKAEDVKMEALEGVPEGGSEVNAIAGSTGPLVVAKRVRATSDSDDGNEHTSKKLRLNFPTTTSSLPDNPTLSSSVPQQDSASSSPTLTPASPPTSPSPLPREVTLSAPPAPELIAETAPKIIATLLTQSDGSNLQVPTTDVPPTPSTSSVTKPPISRLTRASVALAVGDNDDDTTRTMGDLTTTTTLTPIINPL